MAVVVIESGGKITAAVTYPAALGHGSATQAAFLQSNEASTITKALEKLLSLSCSVLGQQWATHTDVLPSCDMEVKAEGVTYVPGGYWARHALLLASGRQRSSAE